MDGPPKKATGSCKNSLYSDTDLSEARSVSDGWAHPSPVKARSVSDGWAHPSPVRARSVSDGWAHPSPVRARSVSDGWAHPSPVKARSVSDGWAHPSLTLRALTKLFLAECHLPKTSAASGWEISATAPRQQSESGNACRGKNGSLKPFRPSKKTVMLVCRRTYSWRWIPCSF